MCPFANLSSIFNILIIFVFITIFFSVPSEYPMFTPPPPQKVVTAPKTNADVLKLEVEKLRLEIELKKLQQKKTKKSRRSAKSQTSPSPDLKEFDQIDSDEADGEVSESK